MPSLNLIKESELFKGLSQDVLEKIAAFCQEAEYSRGATIFSEHDEAQYLYVLEYGLVTLRIDAPAGEEKVMVTAIRDRGEMFGWSALVEPYIYTSAAICLEPTRAIVVDGAELLRMLEEDPESGFVVMRKLAAIIASRLRKAQTALTSALTPGLISHG
jgi:CRP-like cAMP-binding protein